MRIEALTFYRFIAAIMVVAHHFGNGLVSFTMANQMVTFFFVLSGFVMTIAYYPRAEFGIKLYVVNRVSRIVPVYLVALVLTIYFPYFVASPTATGIFLSLTFLQSWFPPYPLSINFPAWSLSVEMFFYVLFPFILSSLKKTSPSLLILAAVIFWGLTQVVLMKLLNSAFYSGRLSASHDLIYFFPLSHLCSFLLGIGGASLFLQHKEKWNIPAAFSLLLISSILMSIIFHYKFEKMISFLVGYDLKLGGSFYAPVFIALILITSFSNNFFTRVLSLKFPILLGEASYALYILQVPVLGIREFKFEVQRLT